MANKVVVYGGRGALGAAVVKHFKDNNYVSFIIKNNNLYLMLYATQ